MTLQEFIHNVEEGKGVRTLRNILIALAALTLTVLYDWRCYRNMNTVEAMDSAQVARNLTEGHGFTTLFIRPFSIYLLEQHNEAKYGPQGPDKDYAEVQGMHPDLANPPLYPCVLAAWMKTYQAGFKVLNGITGILPGMISGRLPLWNEDPTNPLWESSGRMWWWPADFCIALLNQGLLFVVIVLTFFLARKLFDLGVAWLSVGLLVGMELLWRYGVSGLSTMFLMVIVMGVAWCMVYLEREVREPKWGPRALLLLPAAAGLLIGAATMTRYSLACLIIPALLFLFWYGGERQVAMCLVLAATFAAVCAPWIIRNVSVSGTPFGTAGFAIIDGTPGLLNHRLERSIKPDLNYDVKRMVAHKFSTNARAILENELPRLGEGWLMPFFVASLMVGFRSTPLTRLRNFTLTCLLTFAAAQALARTELSTDSPDVNSENLLVLLIPLVLIFSVSLFFVLLNQMKLRRTNLRLWVIGLFGALTWLPLIGAICPPRTPPLAYPPYWLPSLQNFGAMMNERELMMSDVPWAMAWYGDRQCVWLSLNCADDFFAINDYIKPVRALYFTPVTMDGRFVTGWVKSGPASWGIFALHCMERKENATPFPPPTFPLHAVMPKIGPEQLFITDWERWTVGVGTNSMAPP